MLRKTLIAAGVATVVAAGSLAATPTVATAGYYGSGQVHGNGWYFGWGYRPHNWQRPHVYKPPVQKVCQPIYKKVKVFRPYYGWVWKVVYAGQTCSWKPLYRHW